MSACEGEMAALFNRPTILERRDDAMTVSSAIRFELDIFCILNIKRPELPKND